jgi:hypothetical protein
MGHGPIELASGVLVIGSRPDGQGDAFDVVGYREGRACS